MGNSWGHSVRPLTKEEIDYQTKSGENWYQFQVDNPRPDRTPDKERCVHHERKCRISAKCQNLSSHMLTYRYVTGRDGRTSYAEKPICEHHAQKYLVPSGSGV